MFEVRSALHAVLKVAKPVGSSQDKPAGHLVVGEDDDFFLVQVAGWPGSGPQLDDIVTQVCGVAPGDGYGRAVRAAIGEHGATLICRVAPEQIWVITESVSDLGARLTEAANQHDLAVIDLSHSRSRIVIEGEAARRVLAKLIAVDLAHEQFPVDAFALTGLHHTPVTVHRAGQDRFDIYATRTFALTVWESVVDAAREFAPQIRRDM